MSYKSNDDNRILQKNTFRSFDKRRPLTDYEKAQIAIRQNMERLRAERLARAAASKAEDE